MIKRKKVTVGKNFKINGRIFFHGKKGKIVFGNDCMVNTDESINPTSGFNHAHFNVIKDGSLTIGNHVGMSHVNITSACSVSIEDNVLIGSGTKIWDTDFHPVQYEERVIENKAGHAAPVRVCEGAFIGACCLILKGVTIGRHAVVGAGSVVTKDIPDGEIWAGNPARFIRKVSEE